MSSSLRAVQTQIWLNARGSTHPGLTSEFHNRVVVPRPSKSQQKAIADYLDSETTRLDALVAAKERVIDLLAEKRRALITHAVTRGINPDTPLRDSGVRWLGDIPAHWEIERAKWLFVERDERSGARDEELLTVSHITGVTSRSEKHVNMFEPATTTGSKLCVAGDLVVNTLWAWMGAMGVSPVDGIVSPAYHVYVPGPRLEPSYIDALVRLPVFAQEVTRYSKVLGRQDCGFIGRAVRGLTSCTTATRATGDCRSDRVQNQPVGSSAERDRDEHNSFSRSVARP